MGTVYTNNLIAMREGKIMFTQFNKPSCVFFIGGFSMTIILIKLFMHKCITLLYQHHCAFYEYYISHNKAPDVLIRYQNITLICGLRA